jgi:hypothetical protein
MLWHKVVLRRLEASGLFSEVGLVGTKVRAVVDEARFLDIHYDPTTESYSYALIDLGLPYAGDKRLFGWDDYPHEGVIEIEKLKSYPHHFQSRAQDGSWIFEASPMRGDIEHEMDTVIAVVRAYLQE